MGHALERFGETSIYVTAAIATVGFIALPALLLREKRLPPVPRPRLTPKRYIADFFGDPVLRRFGLLVFMHAVFVNIVTGFVVIYAVQTVGISKGEFGSAWSLQSLLALVCAVPLGIAAERAPKQWTLVAGFAIALAACVLGFLAGDARDFIPIALIFGLGTLVINITQAPFFTEFLPPDLVGQLTGAYNICGATGRSLALVGGGWVVSALDNNYRVIWVVAFVFGVLSAVVAASIPDLRYARRRTVPSVE
jgi:MFS family permease